MAHEVIQLFGNSFVALRTEGGNRKWLLADDLGAEHGHHSDGDQSEGEERGSGAISSLSIHKCHILVTSACILAAYLQSIIFNMWPTTNYYFFFYVSSNLVFLFFLLHEFRFVPQGPLTLLYMLQYPFVCLCFSVSVPSTGRTRAVGHTETSAFLWKTQWFS